MSYFQLPANSGEGCYYDFDVMHFIETFQLNLQPTLAALKILELDNYFSILDGAYIPSTILFTSSKESINIIKEKNIILAAIIETLLRTYEGVLNHPAIISEKKIATLLQMEELQVTQQLQNLHKARIVDYRPIKTNTKIFFSNNRIHVEALQMDKKKWAFRKDYLSTQINAIINYIKNETDCRGSIINQYFDKEDVTCGICDNCISAKKKKKSRENFKAIADNITQLVALQPSSIEDLIQSNASFHKPTVLEIIQFLLSENKIILTSENTFVANQ